MGLYISKNIGGGFRIGTRIGGGGGGNKEGCGCGFVILVIIIIGLIASPSKEQNQNGTISETEQVNNPPSASKNTIEFTENESTLSIIREVINVGDKNKGYFDYYKFETRAIDSPRQKYTSYEDEIIDVPYMEEFEVVIDFAPLKLVKSGLFSSPGKFEIYDVKEDIWYTVVSSSGKYRIWNNGAKCYVSPWLHVPTTSDRKIETKLRLTLNLESGKKVERIWKIRSGEGPSTDIWGNTH